jgi:RHS repeat-associated protein
MTMHTQMQLGRTGAAILKRFTQTVVLALTLAGATAALAQQAYYIHPDHLNTPRVIENQSQQVVWRWDNDDPFGANMANGNPSGLGAFTFNLRLPGQYFDAETAYHYNYFRDYNPEIGRYIESDPIGLKGGINTFSYVASNPLTWTDPIGLEQPGQVWNGSQWVWPKKANPNCMYPELGPCKCLTAECAAGIPTPIPMSPVGSCRFSCNVKPQLICTATGATTTIVSTPAAGALAGGACVLVKALICEVICSPSTCDVDPFYL